jgi:hypothetical protein
MTRGLVVALVVLGLADILGLVLVLDAATGALSRLLRQTFG